MGGKRKKSNNGPLKKESKYKIPSRFDCPLCDSKATIVVKVFRATSDATVRCRVCGAGGEKRWNVLRLEKPVDVFFRFHEALIQKDRQDLQRVELSREAQQARLGVGAPGEAMLEREDVLHGAGAAGVAPPAVSDRSWVGGGSAAVAAGSNGAGLRSAASSSSAGPVRHVGSLGELQRKLAMAASSSPSAAAATSALGLRDDFEEEARGAAAHYFEPRQEVHSGPDDDDDYDQLFQ